MKSIYFALNAALIIFSLNSYATTAEVNEITQAQSLLDQHSYNCKDGHKGWWLKLDFSTYYTYQNGGISKSSGQYWGCGTCGECRSKLNLDIDKILDREKQLCTQKGGETKVENRGTWAENINPSDWTISANLVGITCEKWIPCEN